MLALSLSQMFAHAMDIDTLSSLAADAGVPQDGGDAAASADEEHPEWQQVARHWRAKYSASQRGRGAKDGLLDGDSLRSRRSKAPVAGSSALVSKSCALCRAVVN